MSQKKSAFRNLIGDRIIALRESAKPPVSQADLIARLQIHGLSMGVTALVRIEKRQRAVTDFELAAFAKALRVKMTDLFPKEL